MQEFDIMNNKAKLLLLNMNQLFFGERSALTEALEVLLPVLLETYVRSTRRLTDIHRGS